MGIHEYVGINLLSSTKRALTGNHYMGINLLYISCTYNSIIPCISLGLSHIYHISIKRYPYMSYTMQSCVSCIMLFKHIIYHAFKHLMCYAFDKHVCSIPYTYAYAHVDATNNAYIFLYTFIIHIILLTHAFPYYTHCVHT